MKDLRQIPLKPQLGRKSPKIPFEGRIAHHNFYLCFSLKGVSIARLFRSLAIEFDARFSEEFGHVCDVAISFSADRCPHLCTSDFLGKSLCRR